jgi:lipoyl(octanoyl) transferase
MPDPQIDTPEWLTSPNLVPYEIALADMTARADAIALGQARERIWLLEHPPLYTAGTSAKAADLVLPDRFPVHQAGRGGEYTYHGPGQRIAYVHLNLVRRGKDVRLYVSQLESWIITVLAEFGIAGERRAGRVGVWVIDATGREAKIAALGVRVKRWVTLHGISINVTPDLSHFTGIIPCGLANYGVTSFEALGKTISMSDLDAALTHYFPFIFGDIAAK